MTHHTLSLPAERRIREPFTWLFPSVRELSEAALAVDKDSSGGRSHVTGSSLAGADPAVQQLKAGWATGRWHPTVVKGADLRLELSSGAELCYLYVCVIHVSRCMLTLPAAPCLHRYRVIMCDTVQRLLQIATLGRTGPALLASVASDAYHNHSLVEMAMDPRTRAGAVKTLLRLLLASNASSLAQSVSCGSVCRWS